MNLKDLGKPFPAEAIEWRLSQCGESNGKIWAMCLAYISARAILDRLDEVVGPENWQVKYSFIPGSERVAPGVICELGISCGEQWIWKQDGAEQTDIESFKGGISGALKRAGSAWSIGRYLYGLEAGFATIVDKGTTGALYGKTKEGKAFYWLPPALPKWALPAPSVNSAALDALSKQVGVVSPLIETKASIGAECLRLAKQLQLVEPEFSKWAMEFSNGKPTKEMTLDELKAFRTQLQFELGRQT